MKDSYVYTIIFTFVITAFFGAVLAITQAAYAPLITENEENVERTAILKVLGITSEPELLATFSELVVSTSVGGQSTYVVHGESGEPESYAFSLTGQGLWGTIRGYIGVSASFDRLLGLEFVEQNETPGLGGRIDEPWFKEQFQNVPLMAGQPIVYGDDLDAITGATSSSEAVLRILNETIVDLMPFQEVMGR